MNQTDHHVDETKRLLMPNTSPCHLAVEAKRQRLRAIPTTYVRTWTIELVRLDQSMDQGGVPQREKMAIKLGVIGTTSPGLKTKHECHLNSIVTLPDTEAPHTPCALPMR